MSLEQWVTRRSRPLRAAALLLLAGVAVLMLVARPGSGLARQTAAESGRFAGRVAESKAFVGLILDGDRVLAYACDGAPEGVTLSEWFAGHASEQGFDLTGSNGAHLAGQRDGDALGGTLRLADGTELRFLAPRVNGLAGLYRTEDPATDTVAGVILLPDDQQRGAFTRAGAVLTQTTPQFINPLKF